MTDITIRNATVRDALQIAQLRARAWIHAYTDIMDDAFLRMRTSDTSIRENQVPKLEREIADTTGDVFVLVAVDERDNAIGFVRGGKLTMTNLPTAPDAELCAIYVDPVHHGKGFGRALMLACAKELVRRYRAQTFAVGCIKANKSVEFYKRMGGKIILETFWEYPKGKLAETIFMYNVADLPNDSQTKYRQTHTQSASPGGSS